MSQAKPIPQSSQALFSDAEQAAEERHTMVVLVDNEPGVLARVIGLFSGRGYNIDSLTVAEIDTARALSRINIVTTGTPLVIEQIKTLLAKLVPVHNVLDLTVEGPHIERELALVKVVGDRERLVDALRIADFMHARLVDSTPESFVFEMTGTSERDRRLHPHAGARRGEPRRRRRHGPRRPAAQERDSAPED